MEEEERLYHHRGRNREVGEIRNGESFRREVEEREKEVWGVKEQRETVEGEGKESWVGK